MDQLRQAEERDEYRGVEPFHDWRMGFTKQVYESASIPGSSTANMGGDALMTRMEQRKNHYRESDVRAMGNNCLEGRVCAAHDSKVALNRKKDEEYMAQMGPMAKQYRKPPDRTPSYASLMVPVPASATVSKPPAEKEKKKQKRNADNKREKQKRRNERKKASK